MSLLAATAVKRFSLTMLTGSSGTVVDLVCKRFNFVVHAYCEMGNHYHMMVETIDGNLAHGMRQLNSLYSQEFNRRHGLVGHVLQGRYKAILV